jgi:hypothetical protein
MATLHRHIPWLAGFLPQLSSVVKDSDDVRRVYFDKGVTKNGEGFEQENLPYQSV